MEKHISEIYSLLQDLAWKFGNNGAEGLCCADLSLVEFVALKLIYEWQRPDKPSIQAIGKALHFTKSGATRIVDRLEAKDYVRREISSEDGRVCCISITAKGNKTLTGIVAKKTGYLKTALNGKTSAELHVISKALHLLLQSIDRMER